MPRPPGRAPRRAIVLLLVAPLLLACVCPAFTATRSTRLADEPDRQAAAALLAELEQAGVRTEGLSLYVLPFEGKDGNVALAVLDASQGFRFANSGQEDALIGLMARLATGQAAPQHDITRVAVEYRDAGGTSLLTLTASTEAISGFAAGELDREAFMETVDGRVDLTSLAGEVIE